MMTHMNTFGIAFWITLAVIGSFLLISVLARISDKDPLLALLIAGSAAAGVIAAVSVSKTRPR